MKLNFKVDFFLGHGGQPVDDAVAAGLRGRQIEYDHEAELEMVSSVEFMSPSLNFKSGQIRSRVNPKC